MKRRLGECVICRFGMSYSFLIDNYVIARLILNQGGTVFDRHVVQFWVEIINVLRTTMKSIIGHRMKTINVTISVLILIIVYAQLRDRQKDQDIYQIGCGNPAALYAGSLGYKIEIRESDGGGQYGVVIFPDSTECGEWAFYRGECGQEWTCCVQNGYELYSTNRGRTGLAGRYSVCIFPDGSECREYLFAAGRCGEMWKRDSETKPYIPFRDLN